MGCGTDSLKHMRVCGRATALATFRVQPNSDRHRLINSLSRENGATTPKRNAAGKQPLREPGYAVSLSHNGHGRAHDDVHIQRFSCVVKNPHKKKQPSRDSSCTEQTTIFGSSFAGDPCGPLGLAFWLPLPSGAGTQSDPLGLQVRSRKQSGVTTLTHWLTKCDVGENAWFTGDTATAHHEQLVPW